MIADLKPYPEYKESGLPWLGQVPGHWAVLPNRALFAEVNDRNHAGRGNAVGHDQRGASSGRRRCSKAARRRTAPIWTSQPTSSFSRATLLTTRCARGRERSERLRYRGIISPAYVVMRLRNDDDLPSYFHHLYRTPQFAKEAERWSYGITSDMWSLRPEHFKMIYTPCPRPTSRRRLCGFWTGRTGGWSGRSGRSGR